MARTIIFFLFEGRALNDNLRKAEFDEWYSGLYGDRIILDSTSFYIHPEHQLSTHTRTWHSPFANLLTSPEPGKWPDSFSLQLG
jgi:hypothetical protein